MEPLGNPGRFMVLFEGPYELDPGGLPMLPNYGGSLDGEQFLMVRRSGSQTAALIVGENWFEELKRLVPAN